MLRMSGVATSSLGSWADPVTQDSESMCKDLGRPGGSREMALQAPGILLSPELGGGGVGGGGDWYSCIHLEE